MFPRFQLALLLLFLLRVSLYAQPKTNTEVKREYFAGTEKVKSITEIRTTRNMHGDLFNYYKKTTVTRTEFTDFGVPVKKSRRITKLGRSGKPCYELYNKEIEYDAKGQRRRFLKTKCDKQREVQKEYVDGKLVFIRKHKRRRVWSGFWFFS